MGLPKRMCTSSSTVIGLGGPPCADEFSESLDSGVGSSLDGLRRSFENSSSCDANSGGLCEIAIGNGGRYHIDPRDEKSSKPEGAWGSRMHDVQEKLRAAEVKAGNSLEELLFVRSEAVEVLFGAGLGSEALRFEITDLLASRLRGSLAAPGDGSCAGDTLSGRSAWSQPSSSTLSSTFDGSTKATATDTAADTDIGDKKVDDSEKIGRRKGGGKVWRKKRITISIANAIESPEDHEEALWASIYSAAEAAGGEMPWGTCESGCAGAYGAGLPGAAEREEAKELGLLQEMLRQEETEKQMDTAASVSETDKDEALLAALCERSEEAKKDEDAAAVDSLVEIAKGQALLAALCEPSEEVEEREAAAASVPEMSKDEALLAALCERSEDRHKVDASLRAATAMDVLTSLMTA